MITSDIESETGLVRISRADKSKLGYVGGLNLERDSNSWLTPDYIIDAVKKVLGEIDLDPFSSEEANRRIKARYIFIENDSAFDNTWPFVRSVFINPPYGQGLIAKAIEKLIEEYKKGIFEEGILLVNNATDTLWFHSVLPFVSARCDTKGRIKFIPATEAGAQKNTSSNTRGQVLFFFGKNAKRFEKEFSAIGAVSLYLDRYAIAEKKEHELSKKKREESRALRSALTARAKLTERLKQIRKLERKGVSRSEISRTLHLYKYPGFTRIWLSEATLRK